jgi:N-acetylmuramoyl-L-alanine amidase
MSIAGVKEIQEALKKAGFDPGPIDGHAGPRTREAIRAYQKANKLDADGIVGRMTLAVMVSQGLIKDPTPQINPGDPQTKRSIRGLFWHCTATPEGKEFTRAQIKAMHLARGFNDIGYHLLIHLDGSTSPGRPFGVVGAHVAGRNEGSLGFSYIGGLDAKGKAKDTRTAKQKATMIAVTKDAIKRYGLQWVLGHRDASPDLDRDGVVEPHEWIKVCPCFTVAAEYGALLKG